ncbi:hypothetical protein HW555_007111 [Spodoptera exigua]|uniref:AB hydrolase-1 domain-containing protein n=1 Tax=Spodoptera exigua TaxID=7107 RepID=A0A835L5R2_SPOEX|nr:hypothetical protein HW555_007111 [Spodoptera exigua]
MVFSNCINYPRNLDYENPSSCNVVGGRHFNIAFQSVVDSCPIKLGAWHIVPCSMFREVFVIRDYLSVDARLHQELKRTQNTVVLYCHGNSNHRASPHRLQMYKVFQELNFHVITFDYRGYGDSTHVRPTERGVVEDALAMYAWLIESTNEKNRPVIIIWGHSLGTAVAANMAANLPELCRCQGRALLPSPDAVVLEAPFNNLPDEIESHPFSKAIYSSCFGNCYEQLTLSQNYFSLPQFVSWLPYYKDTFVKPFTASPEYAFTTDQYLCSVPNLPVLILHSKGDKVVPFNLAVKLHTKVAESRKKLGAPLVLRAFDKGLGLGHNNLCDAPELKSFVTDFVTQVKGWNELKKSKSFRLKQSLLHI